MVDVTWDQLDALCQQASRAAGADDETARVLAGAVVAAERRGVPAVGVQHFFDYLDAFRAGRLNGSPRPRIEHDKLALLTVSADDGVTQVAYHQVLPRLVEAVKTCGVAVLSISESYTVGELGYYTADLAEQGFVALAASNSNALMSLFNAPTRLTGTNPFSFALPATPRVRVIDQAASAVAWVRIREAAEAGAAIPDGWALDPGGAATTDPRAALAGALLPFGGPKGSNLALVFELLAVLSGAAFSMDAGSFNSGTKPPGLGLFLLVIDPAALPGDYLGRVERHLERIRELSGIDFGRFASAVEELQLRDEVHDRLLREAAGDDDTKLRKG